MRDPRLARRTWTAVGARPTVLVPVGSTEQHGPHLPLQTDSLIAAAVAEAVAAALPGDVLVAPTLAYGASGEHEGFAGTVSIGHEALAAVLVEVVRSLALWAGRVVLVNAHGGNLPGLADTVLRLVGEGHDVAWVACAVPDGDAHAGRTETSLLLHLAPDLVALELAEAGDTTPMRELLPALAQRGVRSLSPNGVLGDPTGASAREGAELFAGLVARLRARVADGTVDERGRLVGSRS